MNLFLLCVFLWSDEVDLKHFLTCLQVSRRPEAAKNPPESLEQNKRPSSHCQLAFKGSHTCCLIKDCGRAWDG